MQTSKVLGAVFAIAIGGTAVWGFSHGLEAAQSTNNNACRDSRLSMLDQNKCAGDLKSATTDTQKKQVIAQYQAKAVTSDPSAASQAPMSATPDATVPSTTPTTNSPVQSSPE